MCYINWRFNYTTQEKLHAHKAWIGWKVQYYRLQDDFAVLVWKYLQSMQRLLSNIHALNGFQL